MSKMTRAQKEAYEDHLRDALALIGELAKDREDELAMQAIRANVNASELLVPIINLLFDELARQGTNAAEGAANAQAIMRELPPGTLPLDEPEDDG
jgi:hypothetical protein